MAELAKRWDGPPLEAWLPWTPAEAARVLQGCGAPWCVVGGWAIDLAIGRQTREHADLEIATPRAAFPQIRAHLEARGLALHEAGDGEVRRLAAGETPDPGKHQNWVVDPGPNVWRMDVMLEPGDGGAWVFRRDERIRAPDHFMVQRGAVPHLKAHGALLFKAKAQRPKDEADFASASPLLTEPERAWLVEALSVAHPGHAWIAELSRLETP